MTGCLLGPRDRRPTCPATPMCGPELRPDGCQQWPGLVEAFVELTLGVRVGHDTAPDPEPDLPVCQLEGPDRDVQLETRQGARDPDRTGVNLSTGSLECAHELHRPDLRGASDRARREGGPQQVGVGHPIAQLACHIGDEMPHARVLLGPPQLGHRDAAVAAYAPKIVAHQVNDHQVLRPVLV